MTWAVSPAQRFAEIEIQAVRPPRLGVDYLSRQHIDDARRLARDATPYCVCPWLDAGLGRQDAEPSTACPICAGSRFILHKEVFRCSAWRCKTWRRASLIAPLDWSTPSPVGQTWIFRGQKPLQTSEISVFYVFVAKLGKTWTHIWQKRGRLTRQNARSKLVGLTPRRSPGFGPRRRCVIFSVSCEEVQKIDPNHPDPSPPLR